MKETLLQRCQREAREKLLGTNVKVILHRHKCEGWNDDDNLAEDEGWGIIINTSEATQLDEIIANTLKQAAEALPTRWTNSASLEKRMKVQGEPSQEWMNGYNQALTDAKKVLLGEDNK